MHIWLRGWSLYCIGYRLEYMILCPKILSIVWKEGLWRIYKHDHNMWFSGGLLAATWIIVEWMMGRNGWKSSEWISQAQFLTGVNISTLNWIFSREIERNGHVGTCDTRLSRGRGFTAANAIICTVKCCRHVECSEKLWRRHFKWDT